MALYEEMNGLGLGQPQVYLPVPGETMPEHPLMRLRQAGGGMSTT